MILFFDTETTGLPDFNARARDPNQPHMVQLAAMLTDDKGIEREAHNVIVQPDGWTIPKEASDVHGITTDMALEFGLPEEYVGQRLLLMFKRASLIVGHNVSFDKFIARIAMRRFDLITDEDDAWWKAIPSFCTMRQMTNHCKLLGKFEGKYKWPTLLESYQHAFGKPFDGAHNAMADLRACKEIYFWLKGQTP